MVVAPALGVRASYYADLCQSFAQAGVSTCAVDLLGAGLSPVRAARDRDWGYAELIEHYRSALIAAGNRNPKSALYLLGHSIGGHVGLMAAGRELPGLRGVALVAAGTPWWTCWPGLAGLRIRLAANAFRLITRTLGYFPGPQIGFAGKEAKTLMTQWSSVALTGRFEEMGWSGEALFNEPGPPTLSISIKGDDLAPAAAVDALVGKLTSRAVTRAHWTSPPDNMNHIRWAKDSSFVLSEILAFIDATKG